MNPFGRRSILVTAGGKHRIQGSYSKFGLCINTFRPRGVYILRGLSSHQSGRSIYTPAEYIYSAIFIRLFKKKYWGYWLQVCTIRPLHVCRFSGCVHIRSKPVEAYASLSGKKGGATSCYVIRLNACLCFMPADSRLQMH